MKKIIYQINTTKYKANNLGAIEIDDEGINEVIEKIHRRDKVD